MTSLLLSRTSNSQTDSACSWWTYRLDHPAVLWVTYMQVTDGPQLHGPSKWKGTTPRNGTKLLARNESAVPPESTPTATR